MQAIFGEMGSIHPKGKKALLTKHYLRRLPPISFAFSMWEDNDVVAVLTFGTPASRHLQKSLCPSDPNLVVELNRMWIDDKMPRNTASSFIAHALRHMPPRLIASYADTTVGHLGYVYRAANFFYAGWTDMERKTPRFDYMPTNGKHSRDAFRSGDFERVRRSPKVKYWTVSGSRKQRRGMEILSGWPRLDWKELPPPSCNQSQPVVNDVLASAK